ncbi:MAG: BolA/IbaG family iron-sulfur metabolism protein [Deltaproteobacteria bacterium]|nr:BolA/IbaG family iron-sulfur metabolism protein [Deltaproteobacteria bacterium]
MYTAEKIQETIAKALPGAQVKITDTTGTHDHFDALVIWDGFKGKTLVEQHQMVMAPLREGLKEAIHALSIKTKEA